VRAFPDLALLAMHSIARARPMPAPDQVLLKSNIFPCSKEIKLCQIPGGGQGKVAQAETVLLKELGLGERDGATDLGTRLALITLSCGLIVMRAQNGRFFGGGVEIIMN